VGESDPFGDVRFATASPSAYGQLVGAAGYGTGAAAAADEVAAVLTLLAKQPTRRCRAIELSRRDRLRVHLSTVPDDLAFFGGTHDAGSFACIFQCRAACRFIGGLVGGDGIPPRPSGGANSMPASRSVRCQRPPPQPFDTVSN
jgi:hypothetical protein